MADKNANRTSKPLSYLKVPTSFFYRMEKSEYINILRGPTIVNVNLQHCFITVVSFTRLVPYKTRSNDSTLTEQGNICREKKMQQCDIKH